MQQAAVSLPLITRHPSETFAQISSTSIFSEDESNLVSVERFWQHVMAVAKRLPHAEAAINTCESRYSFLVSFCAVILRGQINVLPPNSSSGTLASLVQHHAGYLITDKPTEDVSALVLDSAFLRRPSISDEIPTKLDVAVPENQLAAICYTSGSTGTAKPIEKPWQTFFRSNEINCDYYLRNLDTPIHILATVSSRHMWGLETTLLLALHRNVVISDAHPLFPADICAQLEALPSPRMLVSTPTHLRALTLSKSRLPNVHRTLCATSPLDQALASNVERMTRGDLIEIYGCSEMGSMAWRRPSTSLDWQLFEGFGLTEGPEGETTAHADHVGQPTILGDVIQRNSVGTFQIAGRNEDLVNIAGKRGSLSELNSLLGQCPGVVDGVIFSPANEGVSERLAALLVLDAATEKQAVIDYLRKQIDPVFIPRPMLTVDRLPRNENSKLSISMVRQYFTELMTGSTSARPSFGDN